MKKSPVHFHRSDSRFCGNTDQWRRFTFDPNDVSCGACMGRDRLTLSEAGRAYVEGLNGNPASSESGNS